VNQEIRALGLFRSFDVNLKARSRLGLLKEALGWNRDELARMMILWIARKQQG
jgi:hypothetical protein